MHGAADDARPTSSRPRILCLHGYRSSAEVMELQLRPYAKALGDAVELVGMDAPLHATGPADPTIPEELPTYEWYGEEGGSFEAGWKREPQPRALDEALRKEGISLRRFASPAFDACIRMTIGRHEETRAATNALTRLYGEIA